MALKYKTTENGNIMVNDKGLPIVIDTDGKENEEFGIDAIANHTRIKAVNAESKGRKEEIREMKEAFKPFIETDGEESFGDFFNRANEALEQVSNFDEKDWTKTKDVERIKQQAEDNLKTKLQTMKTTHEDLVKDLNEKVSSRDSQIFELMVSDRFNSSTFVKEKLAMTSKMARKYFGDKFKVEKTDLGSLNVVAYDENGEIVLSRETTGENAGFEEALEIFTDKDPDKKALLKGSGASGGGAENNSGSSDGGWDVNPWKADTENLTEQGRILDENPALAKRMAAEAGKVLPEAI